MTKVRRLQLVKDDPWLEPVEEEVFNRYMRYKSRLSQITAQYGSLLRFADAHNYFGIHFSKKDKGWYYREWAPRARDLYFMGDFNHWDRHSHHMTCLESGVWEIFLPYDQYKDRFVHGSRVKVLVHGNNGWYERIPVYIRRVVQDENTKDYAGQLWFPSNPFDWQGDKYRIPTDEPPLIYECHVGMAQEEPRVGTYREFADNVLPHVKACGYNMIQVMAIAEHPYYGSFGYHVSNFFAPSSRFGTPEDLKYMIRKAHEMGIGVIMDVVHSHTVKNYNEGLNDFDGEDGLYTHPGPRGHHPAWDSRLFDYGKTEVLQFLLSNLAYWLKEFHFDGFRFDGVTSMLYFHHGYVDGWNRERYFLDGVEWDAITYLQLANTLVHKIRPDAITIAEDVSGMPGICSPVSHGGIGFDYRLGMGIPDYWIKIIKEKKDEDWDMGELYHTMLDRKLGVKTVAYCESHDQALVGDKTIAFRLMDQEMYWHMTDGDPHPVIDRGIALHKMIRMFTITLGGEAYLNFMGNEFGHPEWIDFPREGNRWSHWYARRQWSLAYNPNLKYKFLLAFDNAMIRLVRKYGILTAPWPRVLNFDHHNKTIVFERAGLIFIFNWHPTASIPDYAFPVPEPGDYKIVLCSDDFIFGGHGRIHHHITYHAIPGPDGMGVARIYNTNRTLIVLEKSEA
ncbi:MAG: alpha-amylase family glycosyl hydrolase [Bacteroidales bacterium]